MKLIARSSSPASAGKHALVELPSPQRGVAAPMRRRSSCGSSMVCAGRWLGVEELVGGNPVVDARHGARRRLAAEHEHRHVLFRVDRAFRGKAEAQQLGPEALPELRLGQQQKVGMPPPHDRQRCDEPRLGREQERFTGLAGVQASTSFETMRRR